MIENSILSGIDDIEVKKIKADEITVGGTPLSEVIKNYAPNSPSSSVSNSLFVYDIDTDTIRIKEKDEITPENIGSDNPTVKALVKDYCELYTGSLWKYNEDGELVPKELDDLSKQDANVTREQIRDIAKEVGVPIGTILPFAGNSSFPEGWLLCNGASVSREMYPNLFAVIGTTYGAVDDDHFNLPNLHERFIEGSDTSGAVKEAGLPNIEGRLAISQEVVSASGGLQDKISGSGAFSDGSSSGARYATTQSVGEATSSADNIVFNASRSSSVYGKSTTVQPPAVTMRYAIKAFNGAEGNKGLVDTTNILNELNNKFDKSGGAISGKIVKTDNNTYLQLSGGLDTIDSAILNLFAANYSYNPRGFELGSRGKNGEWYPLIGDTNGKLSWISHAVETIVAQGEGYIRYSSGLQICSQIYLLPNTTSTITFPQSFINPNYGISISPYGATSMPTAIQDRSSSTLTIWNQYTNAYVSVIAIGRWK